MSKFETYENKGVTTLSPLGVNAWVTTPNLRDSGADYSENLPTPANANLTEMHVQMTTQLPVEIQAAVGEWATHLRTLPWPLRRRAIKRFAGSFADNFLANMPQLSDEEYESLADIGTTCILEQLDDGGPMQDTHQARCYLDSVHGHHQAMAQAYLSNNRPKATTLH